MRILWLGHFVPWPPKGGSLIRSYHLLREAAQGNEVALLCLNQRSLLPTPQQLEDAKQELAAFCASVVVVAIPADSRPRAKERILLRSTLLGRTYDDVWFDSNELVTRLRDIVSRFQPHVVHFDTVGLAPYAAHVLDCPLVLNHHNIESQMMTRRATLEASPTMRRLLRLQARRLAQLEKRTAPYFQAHLVVSELDRERLLELIPGARVEVVHNGVDLDFFRPVPPDRPIASHSLIFVGGLNWYPNLKAVRWLLDEIIPRLRARFPDTRTTIIGRDPPAEFLAAAERVPGLTFTGFVDDIRPYVAEAAVYACPIFDGGGTRLKILDTLAQQVPLVATSMAVEGVGVESGRHALLADNAEEFAAAVGRIFEDPAVGARLAEAGRQLVTERFGWTAIGEGLRGLYAQVADGQAPTVLRRL